MTGTPLLSFEPLTEGILIKRYKRFLADIELEDGSCVTAHCANTGPMTGVLIPGQRVRLRHAPSPTRKLAWTWEQAEVPGADGNPCWVGINTALPNRLIRAAIEAGHLEDQLGPIAEIRAEVAYGEHRRSRIEVKTTTWSDGLLALFPDTITERGQKHLQELMHVLPEARGVLVPCISRPDVTAFAPGDSADPRYGELFRQALSEGVEVVPSAFQFEKDKILWRGKRAIQERQSAV